MTEEDFGQLSAVSSKNHLLFVCNDESDKIRSQCTFVFEGDITVGLSTAIKPGEWLLLNTDKPSRSRKGYWPWGEPTEVKVDSVIPLAQSSGYRSDVHPQLGPAQRPD